MRNILDDEIIGEEKKIKKIKNKRQTESIKNNNIEIEEFDG